MKKLLLFCFLILPISVYSEENTGYRIPEWKDFAPSAFVDVKEPGKLGKFNVVASYWYKRRIDFENSLEACAQKEQQNEQFSCYEELKVAQFKENTDYNARIEARQRAAAGIPEMSDRTDTMLPINNYINNYTRFQHNEFR